MHSRNYPNDDIDPAPPYEPPKTYHGGASYYGGAHPIQANFALGRAPSPQLPGFYDDYGKEQMKMMELNAKHRAQLRRQLRQVDDSEVVTIRTRSSGSKCGLVFFFILAVMIVGGFIALVFYVVTSRN